MRKNTSSRLLLAGDGLSAFGTWIDFLAILTLAAYQYQVTPYQMAIVSAAGLLPGILAASTIGKLCDRSNPKHLLLLSIVFRVVATGGILFCSDYIIFLMLVGVRSIFATVAGPAINVMAMRSVAPGERTKFYSMLNVVNSTAKIIAPALGTVSSSLTNETVALLMSASFSAASLIAFAFVRLQPLVIQAEQAHFVKGKDAVASETSLVPIVWIASTYAFAVFMVNNLVPLILQQASLDKSLLGVLISCAGAGNILSGLWLAKRSTGTQLKGSISESIAPALLQSAGFGLIGILLWVQTPYTAPLLSLMFFVIGTVSARFAITLNVYLSTHYASVIGKVSGVMQGWQNTMILVAPMIGAVILDKLGGPALLWFATASAMLSFAILWLRAPAHVGRFAGRSVTDAEA